MDLSWFSLSKMPDPSLRDMLIPTFHKLSELWEDENCLFDHPSDTNEDDCDYEEMSSISQSFNQDDLKWPHQRPQLVKRSFWVIGYQIEMEKFAGKKELKLHFTVQEKRIFCPSCLKKTILYSIMKLEDFWRKCIFLNIFLMIGTLLITQSEV